MTVRTRFAPSPTGFLHIGGARTALYCWLEARRRGGEFILRIEDTDRERSTEEAVQAILDAMHWLDLDADEGPFYQTQRLARYRQVADELVAAGKAYYAYESKEEIEAMREAAMKVGEKPRYNGYYRDRNEPFRDDPNRVIRFRNPTEGSVVFEDKVKGRIEIANSELDDLVIFRSDGWPTYNFAVVVDDIDMGITEVIRGDDHVNNTPRQINIYQALGAAVPEFAHLPMILDKEGKKLSKRTNSVSVMEYRAAGFLPHAILNYLVRLGWSHGDQEIFSRGEMIALFDIADVNKAASRFDTEKLAWLNQHYLKTDEPQSLAAEFAWHLQRAGIDASRGPAPVDVVVALRDRVHTLKEMAERAKIWYGPIVEWDDKAVAKHLKNDSAVAVLEVAKALLAEVEWQPAPIHQVIEQVAAQLALGMGKVAQPLRVAMTGTQVSPSIEHTIYLAGRDEALTRIDAAIAMARE
ncbi:MULTISPECIES: glutamate--tRNA ligase [Rhodanobacter]|uniref:glutamate--tRNA ligase n=1 Tax=Rhodanobacter TaxID=75309 RepID=UPI000412C8FD|nr:MULTISPECIES: glutamate--tRNA ligase [Rhodanobacter]KZC20093.1 glutamate--tRNA ligase [Rhodanobacter denitrificans]UJJ52392.1 glutamate--tRNA ligase [Rhodanobacter denitrificans]UJM95145.1 glutamate--tRNA ligase [Rhodanobacter denitrificans]UJM98676.1 glutamate--tRNA ligase [Rhodanobacter denitrificans]UJN21909.1 glutamate--tRNA ligase [Rhodanobacter denitrificans]